MEFRVIIFAVIFASAIVFLITSLKRLYAFLQLAKPEVRWDHPAARLKHTFTVAFAQTKILRDKTAGPIHIAIFWGFLVLLFTAAESVVQGFVPSFSLSFLGPLYTIITFSTDLFCIVILLAIVGSFFRRFILRIKRLQMDGSEKYDAMVVLIAIFIIVTSLFLMNASHHYLYPFEKWSAKPFSNAASGMFNWQTATIVYETCWWVHILLIFAFMNYLPYSKHLHVYTSILNDFFSPINIPNKLEKIDFEAEGVEKFGISDIEDFGWKTLFDGYTCTHCGRCDSVCPANITGKVLSPRSIIIETRDRLFDKAPIMIKQQTFPESRITEAEQAILDKKFIGDYNSIEALWQCTTCGACMQECPVTIEHVPAIIGMRRSLVMMESNFPPLLQSTFSNLENNATPWAFSASERADWAEGLNIATAANKQDFDVLFWVGCAGSFDDRAKKVSVAFAKLLQIAGVDFAILGTEEQCTGDTARRAGNEYLADMLVKANVETLNGYNVKKIVTFCPHCFNTLKNEYPDFGGNYEVVHHTQFLKDLIAQGKLKMKPIADDWNDVVYHDSCYLGRYNQEYDAPRNIIESIPGMKLKEVPRSHDKGLCCGAGGSQMFLEETEGKRVNIERTEELLATDPNTIAVNCPFCMTMITDGVKDKDKVDEVAVLDIAEILLAKVITE